VIFGHDRFLLRIPAPPIGGNDEATTERLPVRPGGKLDSETAIQLQVLIRRRFDPSPERVAGSERKPGPSGFHRDPRFPLG
jgi:hypothetical protein